MKVTYFTSAVAALGLVAMAAPVAASADQVHAKSRSGSVYLVQGLPGKSVVAKVDGGASHTLAAKEVYKPMSLSAGTHKVTFSGTHPTWTMKTSVDVSAGSSMDVVVHRPASASGKPVVNVYHNQLSSAGADKGRVVVAHTAVVAPADIIVDGQVVFSNIANGEFASADVPAGTHVVKVVPTGQKSPVILGPLQMVVEPNVLTRVFAIGEPQNGSMDAIVQQLPLRTAGAKAPTSVPLGSAGLVAHRHVNVTRPAVSTARGAAASATSSGARHSGYLVALLVLAAGAALLPFARRRRPVRVHARDRRDEADLGA
jgi:hypothetical protein